MKSYPQAQEKGSPERIFNYRLSRARRITENVFENLSAVFRIFWKYLLLEPETAAVAIMAFIYLHSFMINTSCSKNVYNPPETFDSEDKGTEQILGAS